MTRKRRRDLYPVTTYRLGEWGRWKFHQNMVKLGHKSICPMFEHITPRTYSDNNGIPPEAIQEVIDAMKQLTERRQRVLGWYFVDKLYVKEIGAREGVGESWASRMVDAAVADMAKELGSDVASLASGM